MDESRRDVVLLTLPQAARELGVPIRQLYAARDGRRVDFYQFSSRRVYVRRGEARAWLERHRRAARSESTR
jgi:hypothetical protein